MIPSSNEPFSDKLINLYMLVTLGSYEPTKAEYQEISEAAGFNLSKIIPTRSNISIIEGLPI